MVYRYVAIGNSSSSSSNDREMEDMMCIVYSTPVDEDGNEWKGYNQLHTHTHMDAIPVCMKAYCSSLTRVREVESIIDINSLR